MRNIEVKVGVGGFKEIIKRLKKLGAKYQGELKQIDTYYFSQKGRLKLREIDNKEFQLIFYLRLYRKEVKISEYEVLIVFKKQFFKLKYILKKTFGEKVIVKKVRKLWIYKNTRIHLDKVENLGSFLELETVVKNKKFEIYQKEYRDVHDYLNLSKFKKYKGSYSEMLL